MATALQLASVIYLVGATFQGIAYQPVMLMIIGLQIGLNAYCQRIDSARAQEAGELRRSDGSEAPKDPERLSTPAAPSGDTVTA